MEVYQKEREISLSIIQKIEAIIAEHFKNIILFFNGNLFTVDDGLYFLQQKIFDSTMV